MGLLRWAVTLPKLSEAKVTTENAMQIQCWQQKNKAKKGRLTEYFSAFKYRFVHLINNSLAAFYVFSNGCSNVEIFTHDSNTNATLHDKRKFTTSLAYFLYHKKIIADLSSLGTSLWGWFQSSKNSALSHLAANVNCNLCLRTTV